MYAIFIQNYCNAHKRLKNFIINLHMTVSNSSKKIHFMEFLQFYPVIGSCFIKTKGVHVHVLVDLQYYDDFIDHWFVILQL